MSKPFIVAIAGGSGSGKTTIAKMLMEQFSKDDISVLSQDHYYKDLSHLEPEMREKSNFDHPDAYTHR